MELVHLLNIITRSFFDYHISNVVDGIYYIVLSNDVKCKNILRYIEDIEHLFLLL